MSNRAVVYLRSSKDVSDVSPDAQRRALHDLARARNLVIVGEYLDAVESGKDEDRPAFQRLYSDLKAPGRAWEHILLLDTSRLARRRLIALIFERECQRQKVAVVYRNIPETDPATEMLLKSVLQAFDEFHSIVSRQKGLAGMAENVRQGWRAGGRAPRGYKLEYHATGAVREGEPVTKSRLVVDPETAHLVTAYLKQRAAGVPRGTAIARLQLPWPSTSTHSMDWQALTYAGHTAWNMHGVREGGKSVGGEKRRPRAEWIVTRSTHEALITDEQAEVILGQMERSLQGRRLRESPMLLSGLLRAPGGRGWHSDGCGYYRAPSGRKVGAARLEAAVMELVAEDLQSDQAVAAIVAALAELIDEPGSPRDLAALEKRIATLNTKIGRTVDLASGMEEPAPVLRRVADLEHARAQLVSQAAELRRRLTARSSSAAVTPDQIRAMLRTQMQEIAAAGGNNEMRQALSEVVESVELDPSTMGGFINYALATGDKMASRSPDEQTPATVNVIAFRGGQLSVTERYRRRRAG